MEIYIYKDAHDRVIYNSKNLETNRIFKRQIAK